MRTLLVGCGAIGGVIAAALTRAGQDITVITGNAEVRDAIMGRGILVREVNGKEWRAVLHREPVVHAAELLGTAPFDRCLLMTKTTTMEQALREAAPLLSPTADVICLQNGLPEERAAAIVGPGRVIGCIVGWGASLLAPGASARTSRGGFQIGRPTPTGARDPALCQAADLLALIAPTHIAPDLASVRWSKLAINCATSALGAAGGDTLGRLLQHRFVRRLVLEVWAEICAVARRSGVRLARVAGTLDVERLAITEAERRARVGSAGLLFKHSVLLLVGLKFRRMRSSMLAAIERGRRPEIDHLNGEVVRRGAALGVPAPVNTALVALIHDIVARRERSGLATLRALHERVLQALPARPLAPALPPIADRPSAWPTP